MERHRTDRIPGSGDAVAATLEPAEATGEIPEDVAILYSWANLQGAKYRDFSASRREYRAQMRRNAVPSMREQEPQAAAAPQAENVKADADALPDDRNVQHTVQYRQAEQQAAAGTVAEPVLPSVIQARRAELRNELPQEQAIVGLYDFSARPDLVSEAAVPQLATEGGSVGESVARPASSASEELQESQGPEASYLQEQRREQRAFLERGNGSHLPGELPRIAREPAAAQGFRPDQPTNQVLEQVSDLRAAARASVQEMRQQKIENRIRENRRMLSSAPAAPYPDPVASYSAAPYVSSSSAAAVSPAQPALPVPQGGPERFAEPRLSGARATPVAPVPPARQEARVGGNPVPSRSYSAVAAPPRSSILNGSNTSNGSSADTLLASRERLASRWYALKGVLQQPEIDPVPDFYPTAQSEVRTAVLAVFSLAGGVGKTTLVATLGRALSSMGEQVLLADTTSHGLLPFYFGASELIPGMIRHFSPPPGSQDAPIHMVSYNVDRRGAVQTRDDRRNEDEGAQDKLAADLLHDSRGCQRVLLDLPATSSWVVRRVARTNPTVLIPLAPDMNSVITLQAVNQFVQSIQNADGHPLSPFYVLNQFDPTLPLHIDVREVLRQQLGDRLLPFVLHRSPAVSEALAEGMTVLDYDPTSAAAADYRDLAAWVRESSAPAYAGLGHMRWSER